jgi:hypothetical protein
MQKLTPDIRVMELSGRTFYDHGALAEWLDGDVSDLALGPELGESWEQGAYNRWPVFQGEERIGTLFDDASGLTFKAVDDRGDPIL